jgi:hypothetical protein
LFFLLLDLISVFDFKLPLKWGITGGGTFFISLCFGTEGGVTALTIPGIGGSTGGLALPGIEEGTGGLEAVGISGGGAVDLTVPGIGGADTDLEPFGSGGCDSMRPGACGIELFKLAVDETYF